MGFKNFSNKLANSAKDFNEKKKADAAAKIIAKEEALAAENVRQEQLVKGVFEPVPMTINLDEHESAYAVFNASRYALVDKVTETTTGRTKKKGVVGRAVAGGVLLGPIGALGGAATAGSKTHSTTTLNTSKVSEAIDHGQLILTNNRLLFMGNNGILSLPYAEILAHDFYQRSTAITNLKLKFLEMLPGEYFALSGPAVKDANLYFQGIMYRFYDKEVVAPQVVDEKKEYVKKADPLLIKAGKIYFSPYTMTYKGMKKIASKNNKKP